MSKEIQQRTLDFALEIVKCTKSLQKSGEWIIAKQLMRSGTSIGAMVREANFAESRKDFIHKCHIALKEANETQYWLTIIDRMETNYSGSVITLMKEVNELISILVTILKSAKRNIKDKDSR